MTIDTNDLSSLASAYARRMTRIRGRRVQRLLKREFAGAQCVVVVPLGDSPAVLGLSASGAALCATDGRGKLARIVKWHHGSANALETGYDLLRDSLPIVGSRSLPLGGALKQALFRISPASIALQARPLFIAAIQALRSTPT